MNTPLFSIIIPVYNVEKYLSTCLKSVLVQAFKDYEILLIDDGSKDSSGEICDSYREKYPDIIRVHHKQNQGLISARRAGLRLAAGTYVCFLDSDDCWEEDTLSKLSEVIIQENADVIMFRWKQIDQNGRIINDAIPGAFAASRTVDKKSVFEILLSSSALNSLCLKCCRLSLFDVETDYSSYYGMQNSEDLFQSLPVLYKANSFYYLNEALYQYRINPDSITHKYQQGRHKTLNIVRPKLYAYLEKMGMNTPQNNVKFFRMYLSSLFDEIFAIYSNQFKQDQRYEILNELRSYEFVGLGEKYYRQCDLPLLKREAFTHFYGGDPQKLDRYMVRCIQAQNALSKLKHCIKQICAFTERYENHKWSK